MVFLIDQIYSYTHEVKKSKFIALLLPLDHSVAYKNQIKKQKQLHFKAVHVCSAFIFSDGTSGSSDDGEPHGTAGRPILELLRHSQLHKVALLVVRYFGGTLLGKGGLVHAYTSCAKGVVDQACLIPDIPQYQASLVTNYASYAQVEYILQTYKVQYHTTFLQDVIVNYTAHLLVQHDLEEKLLFFRLQSKGTCQK